ncbi:LOW QUALITY PROTEIN: hypothetical protein QYF61_014917 [Mycteria americana]|uniref:Uncharacterized protein n=1 Tax=Mycteria americana TaxID=33587 RepID=A0AAN7NT71_MYCAM|nr:LOW QUALITY PROTEIN: hypothetical protein QYF61_014917 [Mycteria americana]
MPLFCQGCSAEEEESYWHECKFSIKHVGVYPVAPEGFSCKSEAHAASALLGKEMFKLQRESEELEPRSCGQPTETMPSQQASGWLNPRAEDDSLQAQACCESGACASSRGASTFPLWNSLGWKGPLKVIYSNPPCNEQGHLQLDQVAQSPIQPELECFQGWGIYHLSGQPVPAAIRSPWSLLFSRLNKPNSLSLSSYERCSSSRITFVAPLWTRSNRAEGQNHLPQPAGYAAFDAAQDTVGFLGCECTLSAHVQLFIHQYPQVLLHRAALNPFIPQPVLIPGVAPTQDPALGLVEPHEVPMGPLLQLVQVPLDGIPSLRRVNHTTQLGVICKLAEGALNPTVHVIDDDIKQYWSQYGPISDTTHHQSPSRH